ncbi:MAG TPA: NBR1-Ig-like domain-containing protein [Thermoleophilaceae bacterium]|nr:NBR1-Ig-like domain-containing protein [Thermoleophilaceae bacterium]
MPRPRRAGWDRPLGDRPDQHVGALLHGLREQAFLTQREIAADIGVDPSLISRIERGQRPAPERILRYYGERLGGLDLLESLAEIAREAERQRVQLRDPNLIARQNEYPLRGDEARFVSESPPDGITVETGAIFTKTWTIVNSGTVRWRGRRLRRVGPTTGPWTLTSKRFTAIPDAAPGQEVSLSVELRAPQMETAAVAQWKMVDKDDLLFFPTKYSVGLALYVLVGHDSASSWGPRDPGDRVG